MTLSTGCGDRKQNQSGQYPQKAIKLIVPFSAGGGSDTFARIVQKAIEENELLPEPLVVVNVSGAGGTVGSRRVKNARPDGYTLLLLHEGILTAKYAGKVGYGPEAFTPIAGTGQSPLTVCVAKESPFQSLDDLVSAAREQPDSVLFSCNLGTPSHFAGLMIEKAAKDIKFRYVNAGDGAKRFAGLQGGHADVTALSLAEYSTFKDAGLRALAILGSVRHRDEEEIPTAIEQGYDVISSSMQFWWAPKGTPPKKVDTIVEILKTAMQDPQLNSRLDQLMIEPVMLEGENLKDDIADRSNRIARVSLRPTIELPDIPLISAIATGCLLMYWLFQRFSHNSRKLETDSTISHREWLKVLAVLLITCLYVGVMQWRILDYRIVTSIFILAIGLMFIPATMKSRLPLVATAICFSAGLHFVFTQVVVIDLP